MFVLVNTDIEKPHSIILSSSLPPGAGERKLSYSSLASWSDLLGQKSPEIKIEKTGEIEITLPAGAAYCLSPSSKPVGLSGDAYRRARAQASWATQALAQCLPVKATPLYPWPELASLVDQSPHDFLAAASWLGRQFREHDDPATFLKEFGTLKSLHDAIAQRPFPSVVEWTLASRSRITLVPHDHWLLISDSFPFRASLQINGDYSAQNVESIFASGKYIACFPAQPASAEASLHLERYAPENQHVDAPIRFLDHASRITHHADADVLDAPNTQYAIRNTDLVLLTNGRGGMSRICVDLGRILSKYDCILSANLHPNVPVDRHVFAKRIRVWVNADGFISPLDYKNLGTFNPELPATWNFVANAGDGRTVQNRARGHDAR